MGFWIGRGGRSRVLVGRGNVVDGDRDGEVDEGHGEAGAAVAV